MIICTHDGIFHADELMAIAILRKIYNDSKVVRSRDPKIWEKSDILVDVGGVYGISHGWIFDHHQKGGAGERDAGEPFSGGGIPYSSCGLVWNSYGNSVCEKYVKGVGPVEKMFQIIDKGIISAIDIVDCNSMACYKDITLPLFTISNVLAGFNNSGISQEASFAKALEVAELILANELSRASELVNNEINLEALANKYRGHKVLVMDKFIPGWGSSEFIAEFERVVFPDITGTWRVQVVPNKSLLPEEWAGASKEDLVKMTGVEDAIFCHNGRFIAGAESYDGVLALANNSL